MGSYFSHISGRPQGHLHPHVTKSGDTQPGKSAFGPVEPPLANEVSEPRPLNDSELGQAIADESKLDSEDLQKEIYPAALKLGGSAWVPSTYWDADYRRRLGDAAQELQDQRPLRDREDTQADVRSGLMLDTVFFALEDPVEPR